MLIFGNSELPKNILAHLPNIHQAQAQAGKIDHEINIDSETVREGDTITQPRILIVDDEPFNLDALKIIVQCSTAHLPKFNFKNRIDLASNGLTAVEAVKKAYQNGQTYALILMDCNMPHLDGYEAT